MEEKVDYRVTVKPPLRVGPKSDSFAKPLRELSGLRFPSSLQWRETQLVNGVCNKSATGLPRSYGN